MTTTTKTRNLERVVSMRYGFSEWDEWHTALPGEALLAMANYAGIDAPDVMPAGSMLGLKRSGPRTSTVIRPGWWG